MEIQLQMKLRVYVGNDEEIPGERQFVIHEHSGRLQIVSYLDKRCDPLSYPMIFLRGENGWHGNIERTRTNGRDRKWKRTTMRIASQKFRTKVLINLSFEELI